MAGPTRSGSWPSCSRRILRSTARSDAIETTLQASAVPRTTAQTCGGVPGSEIPNNTYGYGRVDALAAIMIASSDLEITQTDAPDPTLVGVPVTYT